MTMQEAELPQPGRPDVTTAEKGRTRRTLWHTGIYMAGLVTSRGAMFLLLPVITTALKAEFSLYDLCMTTVLFLNPFLNLGLQSAVLRYYFHYDTQSDQRRFYNTALIFLLAMFIPTVAMFFYFADDLARLLFNGSEHAGLFRLTVAVSALTALSAQPLALLRAQERSVTYSILQILRGITGPASIVVLLVVFHRGIQGILWGEIIGLAVLTAAGIAATSRWLYPAFDITKLKHLLAFGLPLLPVALGGALLTASDRYILFSHMSKEAMAPYSLGFKVGMGLSLAVQALQLSWQPSALSLAKTDSRTSIAKSVLALQLILFAMAMAISALAPELIRILAPDKTFLGAHYIIPWIAFSFAMNGVSSLLGAAYGISKRTIWAPVVFCTSGALKLALSFWAIPRYGIMGAAVTTLLAFAVELVLTYFVSQRLYRVPYDIPRFLATYALSAAGLAAIFISFSLPYSLPIRALFLLTFCAASYAVILTKSDRATLRQLALRRSP